jgi:hypothetical protein
MNDPQVNPLHRLPISPYVRRNTTSRTRYVLRRRSQTRTTQRSYRADARFFCRSEEFLASQLHYACPSARVRSPTSRGFVISATSLQHTCPQEAPYGCKELIGLLEPGIVTRILDSDQLGGREKRRECRRSVL